MREWTHYPSTLATAFPGLRRERKWEGGVGGLTGPRKAGRAVFWLTMPQPSETFPVHTGTIGSSCEAASLVTTLNGYQMDRQGRAGPALCIAAIGSCIAGTLFVVFLMLTGPPSTRFAFQGWIANALFALAAFVALAPMLLKRMRG